jgi:hypothetical protein
MSYSLSNKDYISILHYYNLPIPKQHDDIKIQAEKILAKKLCSCIKKVGAPEAKSIGICTRTIFNRKGLKRGTFKCKRKRRVVFSKKQKASIRIGRKGQTSLKNKK